MALLFGATWLVNSIVFFAILVMILLANVFVLAVRPRQTRVYYMLLLSALLLNSVVPIDTFLAMPGLTRVVVSCAVVFLPIFFAGVIFATTFRASARPDCGFWLQHRGSHPGRADRESFARFWVQSSALVCRGLLLIVGYSETRGEARKF